MPTAPPKPLTFPVSFPDIPSMFIWFERPLEEMIERLGPPMARGIHDGLGEADFWGFEYCCGLQLVYERVEFLGKTRVCADAPELEHALRHMPFPRADCDVIGEAELESALSHLKERYPARRGLLDSLRSFQVWRQGDDGNPVPVGEPTSERDARCWVQQLEALGHKQLYWYSAARGVAP